MLLSGEGYVLILYHKMRSHLLNFSLLFFFPYCDCQIHTLAHRSPALLMNSEHGRGRQFPCQWQKLDDQLMGNVTKWYSVQLCWFLSPAMGTKGTWQGFASNLCWLSTSYFSLDRLFWYLFGAWLMPYSTTECPTWQWHEQNCEGVHQSWRDG